jgi:hypothetical protein
MRKESHLRLLAHESGSESLSALGAAFGVPAEPLRHPRRTAPGRPWDEMSPWWAPQHPIVRRLAVAAAEHCLAFDIAAAVAIERSLAVNEIADLQANLVAAIDQRALAARARRTVGGACAVYLRQLAGGQSARAHCSAPGVPVSLPGRLTARLVSFDDEYVIGLLDGDLALALAWERAAVLEARTIGEWASLQALELLSAQAARPFAAPHPMDA